MTTRNPGTLQEGETEQSARDRALWCAVIRQAVTDATTTPSRTAPRREHVAKAQARAWFKGNSDDFRDVCHLAGLDPDAVREHATRLMAKADLDNSSALPTNRGRAITVFIEHDGLRLSLDEWSARLGVSRSTIDARRRRGEPIASILAPSGPRFGVQPRRRGVGRAQVVNAGTGALPAAKTSAELGFFQ